MTTNKIRRRRRRRRCRAKKKRNVNDEKQHTLAKKKELIMNCLFLDSTMKSYCRFLMTKQKTHTHTHNFRIELRPHFVCDSITGYDYLRPCKKNHYYLLNLVSNAHEATKCYAIVGYRIAVGVHSSRGTSQLIRKLIIRNL